MTQRKKILPASECRWLKQPMAEAYTTCSRDLFLSVFVRERNVRRVDIRTKEQRTAGVKPNWVYDRLDIDRIIDEMFNEQKQ